MAPIAAFLFLVYLVASTTARAEDRKIVWRVITIWTVIGGLGAVPILVIRSAHDLSLGVTRAGDVCSAVLTKRMSWFLSRSAGWTEWSTRGSELEREEDELPNTSSTKEANSPAALGRQQARSASASLARIIHTI